jgi:hypothetical protein
LDKLLADYRVLARQTENLAMEYLGSRSSVDFLYVSDAALADDEFAMKSFDEYLFQLCEGLVDWVVATPQLEKR